MDSRRDDRKMPLSGKVPPQSVQRTTGQRSRAPIVLRGCAVVAVLAIIAAVIAIRAWDARDAKQFEGKPLPSNAAYIGRWATDGPVAVRVDTFVPTGDAIACDFTIRNVSQSDVTVQAIGRTIIAQPLDSQMGESRIPLNLMEGDKPMEVVGEQDVLGIAAMYGGGTALLVPEGASGAAAPEPFTLKPGEKEQVRYRPRANRLLLRASALRLAVQLGDGTEPHAFYTLRRAAGVAGWFERGAEKAMSPR